MKLKFRLEYAAVLFLDEIFRVLSWETAQDLGAWLGASARLFSRRRWRMTLTNLEHAFPEKSAEERAAVALEAWRNAGRLAAELIKSRHLSKDEIKRLLRIENPDLCEDLLKEGKGIIINIGHLGNWEVGGIAFTAWGMPLGVVGRVMKNPLVDQWVTETRSRCGEVVFAHRNPFFSVVKWLKQGKMIAILIDHNMHEGGIFVPFFGRPAATSTLSALLSVKLDCPIISARVRREGRGLALSFDGPLRPDPAANPEKEVERLTVKMTQVLEGYIRQRPGEWLWGHNRWKRQPHT